jgi:bifunctional UDP-N-acetylglucosamine pyrophosphorylase/glucosamine-1-phosphate N-acetyltransferase
MPSPFVVLGEGRDEVRSSIDQGFREVVQDRQLGTGHAVQKVIESADIDPDAGLLVTCGDIPGIRPETFDQLVQAHEESEADLTLMTTRFDDPTGYGRVKVSEPEDRVLEIVEETDASPEETAIKRVNTGVMIGRFGLFDSLLPQLETDNEQGELYLTDVVGLLNENDRSVDYYEVEDSWQVSGLNTRRDLVEFEREGYRRRANELLEKGVTVRDPSSVRIGPWVEVQRDVDLEGSVTVHGESALGEDVTVRGDTRIVDSDVGPGTTIEKSVVKSSRIGSDVSVGPYTHVRLGCDVGDGVRLGNFTELKKTQIATRSKVPHLSYVGNAEIGSDVNIGAGTIFCNYDGVEKSQTTIKDGAFIGSNVEIIAPVTIGEQATIGAGSTITNDVPDGSLGVGRARQDNIENWD